MDTSVQRQSAAGSGRRFPVWLKPVGIGVLGVVVLGIIIGTVEWPFGKPPVIEPTPVITAPTSTTIVVPSPTRQLPTTTPSPTRTPRPPTDTPQLVPPMCTTVGATWTRPSDGMMMVCVPGGTFEMGSTDDEIDTMLKICNDARGDCQRAWFEDEQPVHAVVVDGFWMDRTEVTNQQYQKCVADGRCKASIYASSDDFNDDDYPVVGVSWDDAVAYCAWAEARLPTEAQWEYAARGMEGNVYPWGNVFDGTKLNYCDRNCSFGWADKSIDDGYALSAPVGSFPRGPSWIGALDLAGNVWEWTADWDAEYPVGLQINPEGPESGDYKVLRSASWNFYDGNVHSTFRLRLTPQMEKSDVGIRCVIASVQNQ